MDFETYVNESAKTAIYPDVGSNLAYPVLGLIDEIGEYLAADRNDKIAELSDVFWYVAACQREARVNIKGTLYPHINTEQLWVSTTALAGIAKKAMRDNGGKIQEEKRERFAIFLEFVWVWLRQECIKWDVMPGDAMRYNLNKLSDRQKRGVLQGDGDYR